MNKFVFKMDTGIILILSLIGSIILVSNFNNEGEHVKEPTTLNNSNYDHIIKMERHNHNLREIVPRKGRF